MAKQQPKSAPAPAPTTAPVTAPEAVTDPVKLEPHRILISNIDDPLNPRVTPFIIIADSREAAVDLVNKLKDPWSAELPVGSYRSQCRFEEVLPFAREGYGIRRNGWRVTDVAIVHPGIGTRLDMYQRNPEQPHHVPTHQHELNKLNGPDILSEDWSVCGRPPNFGNRSEN